MYPDTSPTAPGVGGLIKVAIQAGASFADTVAALRNTGFAVVNSTDTHTVFRQASAERSTAVFHDPIFGPFNSRDDPRIAYYQQLAEHQRQMRLDDERYEDACERRRWAWPPDGPHPGPSAEGMRPKRDPLRRTAPWAVSMRSYAGR